MDFNSLWTRASAAATEVATAAQEQAQRAAAAAQEQAEAFKSSETFASLQSALSDIAANTISVAEQSERNFQHMVGSEHEKERARQLADSSPKAFGVDDELQEFLKGVTLETFVAFPVVGEEEDGDYETNGDEDDGSNPQPSSSVTMSPWRETHARLVLARIPEVQGLYDTLVPGGVMDDPEGHSRFWSVYFSLCAPRLAKVEAAAAAAVAWSRARRLAAREAATREAEEAALANETTEEAVPVSESPADAARALAAELGGGVSDDETEDKRDATGEYVMTCDEDDASGVDSRGAKGRPTGEKDVTTEETPGGDLESYLNDLLGRSSSDEDDGETDDIEEPVIVTSEDVNEK